MFQSLIGIIEDFDAVKQVLGADYGDEILFQSLIGIIEDFDFEDRGIDLSINVSIPDRDYRGFRLWLICQRVTQLIRFNP